MGNAVLSRPALTPELYIDTTKSTAKTASAGPADEDKAPREVLRGSSSSGSEEEGISQKISAGSTDEAAGTSFCAAKIEGSKKIETEEKKKEDEKEKEATDKKAREADKRE